VEILRKNTDQNLVVNPTHSFKTDLGGTYTNHTQMQQVLPKLIFGFISILVIFLTILQIPQTQLLRG